MTCVEKWNLTVNIVIAIGTVGAVIVALFGDWLKNRIFRSILSAEVIDPNGELTNWTNGTRVIYYHLKIINLRQSILVNQCRVFLKEISKKNNNQQFVKLPLIVPPTLQWAPAESSPQALDFITERVLDIGYVTEGSDTFFLSIFPKFNNFKGYIKANETFRYTLEILSNNSKTKIVTLEISWDGTWHENPVDMSEALRITKL